MPASLRAVLLSALHAAAPAALAAVALPGPNWYLVVATFVVTYGGSLLLSLFHLQLTPQQEQSIAAALAPILAQVGPALLALVEHLRQQPAPAPAAPVVAVTPAPATTVTVTETAAAPAPTATP